MRGLAIDNRLEAIAGKPAGMLTAPGSTAALTGFTAYGDRSLYAVYDAVAVGANGVIAVLGAPALGNVDFTANTSQLNWSTSMRTAGQSTVFRNTVNSGVPGRHVKAVLVSAGMTLATYGTLDNGMATASLIAGGGMDANPVLSLGSPTGAVGLIAVAYNAVHTPYQRTAIMAKLLQMVA